MTADLTWLNDDPARLDIGVRNFVFGPLARPADLVA